MKKRVLAFIMAMMLIFVSLPAVCAEAPAETEEKQSLGSWLHSLLSEDNKRRIPQWQKDITSGLNPM